MITMMTWLKNLDKRWVALVVVLLIGVGGPVWFDLSQDGNFLEEEVKGPPEGLTNFELGQYYFNHGIHADGTYDLVQARKYYELDLVESEKPNKLTWHQLGRIDFLEGKFDDAIEKFKIQKLVISDLAVPNVNYMWGLTYGYKARKTNSAADWQQAEAGFKRYLELEPSSPWARVDLSWLYFSQGKFEDMIPLLTEGLEKSPNNPWLLNMYGLALLNTNQREEALEEFKQADKYAKTLTELDWGMSYPGNDPAVWGEGLEEFRRLIKVNIKTASEYPQS